MEVGVMSRRRALEQREAWESWVIRRRLLRSLKCKDSIEGQKTCGGIAIFREITKDFPNSKIVGIIGRGCAPMLLHIAFSHPFE